MATDKDTIYVDVDDEITTIIDKVKGSGARIVALVLPKRATVFQSIVNMKLLKRAADSTRKRLVLVTTEANLMPLAGAVGLYVAASPQSKPEIPAKVELATEEVLATEPLVDDAEYTADNAGDQPVGELVQRSGHVVPGAAAENAITLDDEADSETAKPAKAKSVKQKHLKVPNFNRFRIGMVLAALGIVVIGAGLYVALVILPKATITITTDTSTVNVNLTPTLDTTAQKIDLTKVVLPAKTEQKQQTTTQQVAASGEKNTGEIASGTVTMSACIASFSSFPNSVPAGTGISVNGLTFITQETTKFSHAGTPNGSCIVYPATDTTKVTAQNAGTKYNVSNATFTVAGRSDVTAAGSADGGTDSIIKIVSQADIDSAKQKLSTQDTTTIQASLQQALRLDGLHPLTETFNAGAPVITTSANPGDTADNVTVTQAITYTMYGVKDSDLNALIQQNVDQQIDTKNQSILNNGLSGAKVTVEGSSGSQEQITIRTIATVGPDINAATVKKQAAGKRIGDVKSMLNVIPGVTDVEVHLSPFWVSTVPSNAAQVTVTIDKAQS